MKKFPLSTNFSVFKHAVFASVRKPTQTCLSEHSEFINSHNWKDKERDLALGPSDDINQEPTRPLQLCRCSHSHSLPTTELSFPLCWHHFLSLLLKNNENFALYLGLQIARSMFLMNHCSRERWLKVIIKSTELFYMAENNGTTVIQKGRKEI